MKTEKSVLIVEDDEKVGKAMTKFLKSSLTFEFEVCWAKTPRDLIANEFDKKSYDGAILDLRLEGKRYSFGFLKALVSLKFARNEPNFTAPDAPIIVYSAYTEADVVVKALSVGATQIVPKASTSIKEVVSLMESTLEESENREENERNYEQMLNLNMPEWRKRYLGKTVVFVDDQIVADGAHVLEAMIEYDSMLDAHENWPDFPRVIDIR
jgi:DNA-binding NtrC family response regulator